MARKWKDLKDAMRRFIEALGGELQIRARFPGVGVVIDQFESLDAGG